MGTQPLSSGRWDAFGSWDEAVKYEREKAQTWAFGLSLFDLRMAVMEMEHDTNAFTLYQRRAVLQRCQVIIWDAEQKQVSR